MRRLIVLSLAASLILAPLTYPRKANAFIGGATALITFANPVALPVAVITLSAGIVSTLAAGIVYIDPSSTREDHERGLMVFILGTILLDQSTAGMSAFPRLNPSAATALGVSTSQIETYNQFSAELSAVAESIQSEAAERIQQGERVTIADLHARWVEERIELGDQIAPDAFLVGEKIADQIFTASHSKN